MTTHHLSSADTAHIAFGRHGNGFQYLLGGWSHDNTERSWTIGHESHVLLPRPCRPATYRLSLSGIPFTAPSAPFQRLLVRVNGRDVGRFMLNAAFTVECTLPWSLLADSKTLTLTFRHPDAVRPRDVSDVDDRRWIAVAFTGLSLAPAAGTDAVPALPETERRDDAADALAGPMRFVRTGLVGPQDVAFRPAAPDWMTRPLIAHFVAAAARDPAKIALDDGRTAVSYGEVLRQAAGVAARIADATAPGAQVAVRLRDPIWRPIAVLGCLAAGRSCVVLDPDGAGPAGDLVPALQIVDAISPAALAGISGFTLPTAAPPRALPSLPAVQETAFLFRAQQDPAVSARVGETAVLLDIGQYIETCHLNDADRHLVLAPPDSPDALRGMLAALLTGATLHVVDPRSDDPAAPLETLRRAPISVCAGSLAALLAVARLPEAYAAFQAIRLLRIEDGAPAWNDIAVLRALLPRTCHVLKAYAPAESLTCLQHFVTMPSERDEDLVPAGYALPGFAVSVVDADGSALPDGSSGELLVAGAFMRERLRTGRKARRRANGLYDFVTDSQPPASLPETYDAVCAAWQAVLGERPQTGDLFGSVGGDSLKLIEFAVELENRLARRLPMSLLALQMDAETIAAAVVAEAAGTAAPTLLAHDLVQRFESLGGYCELGFVQRACQVEPYSLLRFAGTTPAGLIAALDGGFADFGDPANLRLEIKPSGEYAVRDLRYDFGFHTDIMADALGPEDMLARESRRLGFLAARMREELATGRPIYLYRSHGPHEDAAMPALHRALQRYGPNRLLWVMSADADHRFGSTELITDSLMAGYVDPAAVINEGATVRLETWLEVCTAAYRAFSA